MNIYSIALFLHIVGALGFFIALSLEWTSLRHIRGATTTEKIKEWMRISNSARKLGIASMLTILASGVYMMATAWGGATWIVVALGAFVLLIVISVALTGPRMAAIIRSATIENGPVSPTLHALANHPFLWISIQTRVSIALGIVFLMTVKPGLGEALLAIGIVSSLGLALSLPMLNRERVQEGPAD